MAQKPIVLKRTPGTEMSQKLASEALDLANNLPQTEEGLEGVKVALERHVNAGTAELVRKGIYRPSPRRIESE